MKAYQFTAKNDEGEVFKGVLEAMSFNDAMEIIRRKELDPVAVEESQHKVEDLRASLFGTIGSGVKTVPRPAPKNVPVKKKEHFVSDEELYEKKKQLFPEKVQEPVQEPEFQEQQAQEQTRSSEREGIVFHQQPNPVGALLPEQELLEAHEDIQALLRRQSSGLSTMTRERLEHLLEMLDLVREQQNKKRWRNLKREIKKVLKIAQREMKAQHDQAWQKVSQAPEGHDGLERYDDVVSEVPERKIHETREPSRLVQWFHILDQPNQANEEEVVMKQQYESVWIEMQRFTSALVAFYLFFLFVSYYLKRSGVADNFLLRVYDTTLFKQLVLVLFITFTLLTLRRLLLPKRVASDAVLVLLFLGITWWVFWGSQGFGLF